MSGRSVRLIAAELRARIIDRLARRLNCSPSDISVEDGTFRRDDAPTGHDYWNFSGDEDFAADITGTATPKNPDSYKIVGQPVPRTDLEAKVSGAAFVHDMVRPDLLHARILRQPSREATLAAFDEAAVRRAGARRVPRGARRQLCRLSRRGRNGGAAAPPPPLPRTPNGTTCGN